MSKNQSMRERLHKRSKLGFSLVELIVVVAIMAVLVAVLAPSLLAYVERTRAQKDTSAMDELTNAVLLAMSDMDVYDELLVHNVENNVSCYIDNDSETATHVAASKIPTKEINGTVVQYIFGDGARVKDEFAYFAAGNMRGVTITFAPNVGTRKTEYTLSTASINKFIDNKGAVLEDCPILYNRVRATIGDKIELNSQTYRNSEFTIFIRMGSFGGAQASAQNAIAVYGQFNGTNLAAVDNSAKKVAGSTDSDREMIDDSAIEVECQHTNVTILNQSFAYSGDKVCNNCQHVDRGDVFVTAGLYNDDGSLQKDWDTLISEGYLSVQSNAILMQRNPSKDMNGVLVLPDNIRVFAGPVFKDCNGLTSVIMQDGLTSLGSAAFSGCKNLTNVVIPNSVTNLGMSTFDGCGSLNNVVIPNGVTEIGTVFIGCDRLSNIIIPDSVTMIYERAFYNCSSLTNITLPDSIDTIYTYAFWGCTNLTSINIPDNVTSIGYNAFLNCTNLTSVEFKNTSGWKAGDVELDPADLENKSTAVTFLKETYVSANWTRSE